MTQRLSITQTGVLSASQDADLPYYRPNRVADIYVKTGFTDEDIQAELLENDGSVVDLTGDDVKFQMALPGADSLKVDTSASIDSASDGHVSYSWSSADVDTVGYYNAQFVVDPGTTGTFTEPYPDERFLTVRVGSDLV